MKPARTLAIAVLLIGLAGCSDDSSSDAQPDPTPSTDSAASTAIADPTSTPSTSTEPAAEVAFPGVAPADGPRMRQQAVALRVPADWTLGDSMLGFDSVASRGSYDLINLTDQDQFGSFDDSTTDEMAKLSLRDAREMGGTYQREDDVMVDGFPASRITGVDADGLVYEEYTASREGRLVILVFKLAKEGVREDPDLVASVVNSWTWR